MIKVYKQNEKKPFIDLTIRAVPFLKLGWGRYERKIWTPLPPTTFFSSSPLLPTTFFKIML